MKRKAVGFYWTLPVPWAGFTRLPAGIDEAAKASRTIRYQRSLIHDYAQRMGMDIVHEEAFLEIAPDRGSNQIVNPLDKAARFCRQHGACLLYVDFTGVQQWRGHDAMKAWLAKADLPDDQVIEAAPIVIDGELFDPHAHFSEWREAQWAWSSSKHERADKARARAQALQAAGMKYPTMARVLNEEGLRSLSGKPWTADNLRKLLATQE